MTKRTSLLLSTCQKIGTSSEIMGCVTEMVIDDRHPLPTNLLFTSRRYPRVTITHTLLAYECTLTATRQLR